MDGIRSQSYIIYMARVTARHTAKRTAGQRGGDAVGAHSLHHGGKGARTVVADVRSVRVRLRLLDDLKQAAAKKQTNNKLSLSLYIYMKCSK